MAGSGCGCSIMTSSRQKIQQSSGIVQCTRGLVLPWRDKTMAVAKADLQFSLASTELRIYFFRVRLGKAHHPVMQSQTAFLKAL